MIARDKKQVKKQKSPTPPSGAHSLEISDNLYSIHEITNAITSYLDLKKILEVVFRESKKIIHYDLASIDLMDDTGKIHIVYFLEPKRRGQVRLGKPFPIEGTGINWVMENKRPLIRSDFSGKIRYREDLYIKNTGVLSGIVMPLIYRGKVIGTFNLGSKEKNSYSLKHARILKIIAGHIAIALENARIYGTLQDHTKNLEEKVAARTQELEDTIENLKSAQKKLIQTEKLAATSKLVAGVAHEVKNPLSAISFAGAIIETALKTGSDLNAVRESCRDWISIQKDEVERLKNLVDRFLEFGRPSSEIYEKTDINGAIRQALRSLKWEIEDKQIQLIEDYSESIPEISIEKDEFHRAIVNIMINSIQASNSRGIIEVKTYRDSGHIFIEIQDNGCGISPDIQDRVFDIFFTTKDQGSGIGLSQVFRTVESHNGNISISSEVDKGTRMQVKLPIWKKL